MKNRYNQIKNFSCLALLALWVGCTKVDYCDDPTHIHKTPGKTTVTVDWSKTSEDDANKESMRFAFYPEKGGAPILVETDYGFAQTELEPGDYRVIAFNRKAENIETTLPDDYRKAKASVSQQLNTRAGNEVMLDQPGWFVSGVGTVQVDDSRTGELVLEMTEHVRKMNIKVNIDGDIEAVKRVSGELNGLSRSINLNTNQPWDGENGRIQFQAAIHGESADFSAPILGIDPTATHNITFSVELEDGTVQTVSQNITELLEGVNDTEVDVQLDVVATIRVEVPAGGSQPEVSLDDVQTTGSTTFKLEWADNFETMSQPESVKYVFYPANGGETKTFTGDNNKLTVALEPGDYRVLAYGEGAQNVEVTCPQVVDQAIARVVAVEGRIPEPGYFFVGAMDVNVQENAIQSFPLPVANRTKDFSISMKVKGDGRLITKIEAVLTGITEAIYLNNGKVLDGGKEYVLHASNDATEINISGRVFGIDQASQQVLRLKLTYKNGEEQNVEEDISGLLEDFNNKEPEEIPDIEADVEISSPSNTNISASITNWKVTERDIVPGKGDNK